MSRYDASPSPSRGLYEAPQHRGRGGGRRQMRTDSRDGRDDAYYVRDVRGGDGRMPPPRPADYSQSRSRSRPGVAPQRRRGYDDDQEPPEDEEPQRQRTSRRGGGGVRREPVSSRHSSSRHPEDMPKERDRGRDRERGRRDREREYRKMAQQNPMQMAMMQGMMGGPAAMQMAMMHGMGGMPGMPPGFMHPAMRPPMMFGGPGAAKKRRRGAGATGGNGEAADAAGSSSSSSSSDSSDESNPGLPPHAAMAAMAGMWPGANPAAQMAAMHHGGNLEAYLRNSGVDPEAADRLRALPPHLQQVVMRRGPLGGERNPSAMLIARVRDAELGASEGGAVAPVGPGTQVVAAEDGQQPARRSAKVTIETMIRDYRLSAGCAWMLRALPPDKQKLASRIDPAGQADPSGYVAEQMKNIV